MKKPRILVINPGSTSTKIALFTGLDQDKIVEISHLSSDLGRFKSNLEQVEFRSGSLRNALTNWGVEVRYMAAIIGRGGPLKPLSGGVYRVGEALMSDLRSGKLVDHASILGGILAYTLAKQHGIPSFIADPVSVDEFDDVARISGLPELPRLSLSHALNIKAVVAEVAREAGKKPEEMNYIVAHLGGGFSIAAHKQGRQVDVNNANDAGPFSPERVGTLPLSGLLKMCFSGKFTHDELKKKMVGKGGLIAHFGTADVREIDKRIDAGDKKAKLILEAMAYQISKEIGAMATVMHGKVDGIILTGGVTFLKRITDWITERVKFIAPVILKPGQNEMKALARHAVVGLENPGIVKEY